MQINQYHGYFCQVIHFFAQLALLGLIAHGQILLIPVCHVQLTQPQVELLLQLATALQDTSELQMMVQRLHVLVSQLQSFHKSAYKTDEVVAI